MTVELRGDVLILFASRLLRLFAYGLLSVVLALAMRTDIFPLMTRTWFLFLDEPSMGLLRGW
jgi:hypothetical protein